MFNEKIKELLNERASFHDNDPMIDLHREKLVQLLSSSEKETISFLENCTKAQRCYVKE
jgi:hypothetical protein